MAEGSERRVLALVLSHNAPQSLARCLAAIGAQDQGPEKVVVVDNASEPPVQLETLPPLGMPVEILRSEVNGGPAGGWALALRYFLNSGHTHAWLMDDDIVPEPACLDRLWTAALDDIDEAFVVPISIQPDGTVGRWGSWCGFMIARKIVATVGLPMEELFWWAEDTEYCHWRIPQAGFNRRVIEDAVVHHDAIRRGGELPTWKYYYEARNMLYYHLHVMHRVGWFPRNATRLLVRCVVRQRTNRMRCLVAIARGFHDGARQRLGIRYPVSSLQERSRDSSSGLVAT